MSPMMLQLPRKAHTHTLIGHLWMRAVLQGAAASCTVVVQEIVAPLKLVSAVLHSQQSSIST